MRLFIPVLAVFLLIGCDKPGDDSTILDPTKRQNGLFGETLLISPKIGTQDTKFTLNVILLNQNVAEFTLRWDFENDGEPDTPWLDSLNLNTELPVGADSLTCQIRRNDGYWSQITRVNPVVEIEKVTESLPALGQGNMDISPTGDRIVFNWRYPTNEHQVYEMDLATGDYTQISTSSGHFPDYSFNGEFIAYDGGDGLHVYNKVTSSDTILIPDSKWNSHWVRWSPKENTFLTAMPDGMVLYDFRTHQIEVIDSTHYYSYCWHPDGDKIALSESGHSPIRIFDLATRTYLQDLGAQDIGAKLDWSPDGQYLSLGVLTHPNLPVLNIDTEQVIIVNPGDIRSTWYPSWAPAGGSLYFEGIGPEDAGRSIWKIGFPTGR